MAYAIELGIGDGKGVGQDAATVAQELWVHLEHSGFLTPGRLGFKPHVTLSVFDSGDPEEVVKALHACDMGLGRSVEFSGFDVFQTDPSVVYLRVAPRRCGWIREIQSAVYEQLLSVGITPREYYTPEEFVPHCTLAELIPPQDVGRVLSVCKSHHTGPLEGKVRNFRVIRFPPVATIHRWSESRDSSMDLIEEMMRSRGE